MLIHNFYSVCIIIMCLCTYSVLPVHHQRRQLHTLNGRYTKDIEDYHLIVPRKLTADGEFESFKLPHRFKHEATVAATSSRKKRSNDDPGLIHYGITLNGKDYHIELWPNRQLLDPNMVVENRDPTVSVNDRILRSMVDQDICHYVGQVRGLENSRAALSTCNGLSGYITIGNKRYFIEPVDEHQANSHGHHLHLIYDKNPRLDKVKPSTCGTNSDWEAAWKDRFRDEMQNHVAPIRRRSTESVNRYLKTLVVCDKRFIDFHKSRDLDTYVMTVMNMVADFYHDSSAGHMMDVIVVRIIYLEKEEEEIDLVITQQSEKTLASFCKWQQSMNPHDSSNPNHHDIAVLLTRWDICAADGECGLTGQAYVAAACTNDRSCAINEDNGLVLGIVVAHEMGHVMGCSHDTKDESSCPSQDNDESYFIMAPFVNLYTIRWSTCSRGFMTALFEDDLGECLNDEPGNAIHKYANALPGTIYDGDAQCEIMFPNSKICMIDGENFCEALYCKTGGVSCMGNNQPPADGTKCGTNMWCFRKKCISVGERPEAVAGGWGSWGSWSSCSRTCGGGISVSERDCDNPVPQNKGRYCIGQRKKVKICNTTPCPTDSPSFLELQCSEHNKNETWKPFPQKDKPCELNCVNEKRIWSKLAPMVKDGTPCKPGTKNKCIFGVCTKIGCDNQVDSDAVEDVCGICNGDGTQCKIIEDVYKDVGALNYKKVVTIPARSRNIRIDELAPSKNIIAITDKTEKHFFLNGKHQEWQDGVYKISGSEAVYSHSEPGKESLVIFGPIKDDIIFLVCFVKKENVGYRYKYAEATADLNYTPRYHWELLDWTDCTVNCGGGTQASKYECVEDKAGKVSASFCMGEEKPELKTKKCNEKPCETRWRVGKWGQCHACKGKSGVRMRQVECIKESPTPGGEDALVEDKECGGSRPATRELCNAHKTCRRHAGHIPEHQLRNVWSQIHRYSSPKRQIDIDSLMDVLNNDIKNCQNNTKNITLEVGKIVVDHVPDSQVKLIRIPLKNGRHELNLTDNAFETMGNPVGDNVDTSKAEIIVGKQAAEIINELRTNKTAEEETSANKKAENKENHSSADKNAEKASNNEKKKIENMGKEKEKKQKSKKEIKAKIP